MPALHVNYVWNNKKTPNYFTKNTLSLNFKISISTYNLSFTNHRILLVKSSRKKTNFEQMNSIPNSNLTST